MLPFGRIRRFEHPNDRLSPLVVDLGMPFRPAPVTLPQEMGRDGIFTAPGPLDEVELMSPEEEPHPARGVIAKLHLIGHGRKTESYFHLGDGKAEIPRLGHILETGVRKITAGDLRAAFHQMAYAHALA